MSSTEFRQIALKSAGGKPERLVRAAVSAYCSLTRPTRHDAARLEDLALPLYDSVSPAGRRYIAAALSECRRAPAMLVRRLAEEPVDIAASVLLRSGALTDIDLVAIIARHGLAHARAIGGRRPLTPAIANLVAALEAAAPANDAPRLDLPAAPERSAPDLALADLALPDLAQSAIDPQPDAAAPIATEEPAMQPAPQPFYRDTSAEPNPAEEARARLRAMMAAGGQQPRRAVSAEEVPELYQPTRDAAERLAATALTGTPGLFHTALADALGIHLHGARALATSQDFWPLALTLRGLELSREQAFLILSAARPGAFPHTESIRLFLDRYRLTHVEAGRDAIRNLRTQAIATHFTARRKAG